jgi:hypothetical protein
VLPGVVVALCGLAMAVCGNFTSSRAWAAVDKRERWRMQRSLYQLTACRHQSPQNRNNSKHTTVGWRTATRQTGTCAHDCVVHVAELVHQLRQDKLEAVPADLHASNEQSSAGGAK